MHTLSTGACRRWWELVSGISPRVRASLAYLSPAPLILWIAADVRIAVFRRADVRRVRAGPLVRVVLQRHWRSTASAGEVRLASAGGLVLVSQSVQLRPHKPKVVFDGAVELAGRLRDVDLVVDEIDFLVCRALAFENHGQYARHGILDGLEIHWGGVARGRCPSIAKAVE